MTRPREACGPAGRCGEGCPAAHAVGRAARCSQSQQPVHALASRTSLADGEAQPEVLQDLNGDPFVERANGGQHSRDPARPVFGLHLRSQRRHPVPGMGLHCPVADPHRGRDLSLGQTHVILQRDRLSLPVVESAEHSHDSRPSQQPGLFMPGTRTFRQGRALSLFCRELA